MGGAGRLRDSDHAQLLRTLSELHIKVDPSHVRLLGLDPRGGLGAVNRPKGSSAFTLRVFK